MKNFSLKMVFVFFFFLTPCAKAQIIYTDVIPDTAFSDSGTSVSIDLNKDGLIDFELTISTKKSVPSTCGAAGFKINKYLRVTPADTNNSILNNSNLPSALALSTIIDSNSQYWKHMTSQIMATDTYRCISSGGRPGARWYSSGSGNFRNTTDKYLAVRFYAGTQLYYGWIRFSITSNVTVTIKDYAYQSSGTPFIIAGQTSDNYILTSASTSSRLCAIDTFDLGYVLLGNFDTANIVSIELSDSVGKFTKGTIIGSKKRTVSGTIPCVIPPSISGIGYYRYRAISSNPALIATDNGINLTINKKLPDSLVTPTKTQVVCNGSIVALSAPLENGNLYQWKKDGVNLSGSGSTTRFYNANTTGLFSCDISNGCGTVHSNVVSLTVLPALPAINITPNGPLTFNSGDSVLLSSSIIDTTLIYRWYRNNVPLNTLFSAMTYMAKVSGTYTLKINDAYGCSKTSMSVVVKVLNSSAVPETNHEQSTLKVYPNPFTNNVFISFSIQDRQKFSVRIVDVTGRLVQTIASDVLGDGKFEYNWMADLQNGNSIKSGIYYLILEANTFSQIEKLILVR